jgi:multiple sugar transport system substrate-binding protein
MPGSRNRRRTDDQAEAAQQQEKPMKTLYGTTAAAGLLALSAGTAAADCGIESGSVRILSNDFEVLHIIGRAAEECAGGGVTVTKNQTTEHKNLQVPALTVNPAQYTVAIIANNSIAPLLTDGLVRPLDDLVAAYGQDLQDSQLVRVGGEVMAIAFMANAQHLHYRSDLLEAHGIEPPTSYEDILAAAETLRTEGGMEHPIAANFAAGWDLAAEFVNMYLGLGGEFFEGGSAEPAINNETGVEALEMLKALSEYMSPDYLSFTTNELKPVWEAGDIAIMNQWGSRAGAMIDESGPAPEIARNTVLAAAPTVGGGEIPAAALWWDGFTIARNISDEDAEASFRAMVHAISPAVAQENPNVAAWLVAGYEPGPGAAGTMATAQGGARPYPMAPYMGVLHNALGAEIVEFMQGSESAEQALADTEAAYRTAAREAGFLN